MTMPAPPSSFVTYRQAEFALVAGLERLYALAAGLGLSDLARQVHEARTRIEQHRFTIAVVGEFKRGKSTFINALLGQEILPADVAPTSATLNRVTYGLKPAVKVVFKEGRGEHFVEIGQLADYVTKLTPEAEALASTVEEAVVYYPVPFCKNNVDIIDTPGLSDDVAMTKVTLGILSRVDAAILVILATSPFSQSEAAFLESLLLEYGLGSVLFVVTAIDRLPQPKDRDRILSTVSDRVSSRIRQHAAVHFGDGTEAYHDYLRRVGEPRVFGISGHDALTGKVTHDGELLAASRLPELEAFLERFLTKESALVALRTHTERVVGICETLEKETARRRAAAVPAASGAEADSLDALLRALEWLAQDAARRVDDLRPGALERLRPRLQALPEVLRGAAEKALERLDVQAADLEPDRVPGVLAACRARLDERLQMVSAQVAQGVYEELTAQCRPAAEELLVFAGTFDRVMAHARSALAPPSKTPPLPMVARLGGDHGFERRAAVEAVLHTTLDESAPLRRTALTELLSLPRGWADGVEIRAVQPSGPKFARKAVDLYRVEKLKSDVKAGLLRELALQVEKSMSARDQALGREVADTFSVFGREIEQTLEKIGEQREEIRTKRQKRAAAAEQEGRRMEEMGHEIRGIRDRSQVLARELSALGAA